MKARARANFSRSSCNSGVVLVFRGLGWLFGPLKNQGSPTFKSLTSLFSAFSRIRPVVLSDASVLAFHVVGLDGARLPL